VSAQGTERAAAPPAVAVDRVTTADIPAICSLYKRIWEPAPAGLPPEFAKSWVPTPLEFTSWMEGVTYFSTRKDGKLIGVVGLEVRYGAGRLVHLAVDPEHRRQGVASALITTAVDWAKRSNATSVWADALARFPQAVAMFKRLGFSEAGILHRHQWGEDVRYFERLL
jgi:RimJ/RimL family protein N-acetyltransferase